MLECPTVGTARSDDRGMRHSHSLRRLIPVTALRQLYRLLRAFPKEEFHLAVAREMCRRPTQLARIVDESQRHFALYDNRGQGFHNREMDIPSDRMLGSDKLANRLVRQLVENEGRVGDVDSACKFAFRYVDYEISPIRTTESEFEDGVSGQDSGAGGMDLLLSNLDDQTPIIGEIKADTDVNPFLGLIQSLMYAVELSTPAQRARLRKTYPDRFVESELESAIDIYLILLRYPKDPLRQEFLELTSRISAALLAADSSVSRIVRRIVALENSMSSTGLGAFSVAFAHGNTFAT